MLEDFHENLEKILKEIFTVFVKILHEFASGCCAPKKDTVFQDPGTACLWLPWKNAASRMQTAKPNILWKMLLGTTMQFFRGQKHVC